MFLCLIIGAASRLFHELAVFVTFVQFKFLLQTFRLSFCSFPEQKNSKNLIYLQSRLVIHVDNVDTSFNHLPYIFLNGRRQNIARLSRFCIWCSRFTISMDDLIILHPPEFYLEDSFVFYCPLLMNGCSDFKNADINWTSKTFLT